MGGDSLSITLTPSEPLWSITQRIADLLANAGPDAKVSLVLWPKGTLDDVRFTSESAVPASAIHVYVIARQPADPDWPPPPPEPVPAPAPTPVPAPPVITSMWTTREMNIRAKVLYGNGLKMNARPKYDKRKNWGVDLQSAVRLSGGVELAHYDTLGNEISTWIDEWESFPDGLDSTS